MNLYKTTGGPKIEEELRQPYLSIDIVSTVIFGTQMVTNSECKLNLGHLLGHFEKEQLVYVPM